MRRIFAIVAMLGFIISFLVHFATYIGFNALEEFPALLVLHIISLLFGFSIAGKLRGQRNWRPLLDPIPKSLQIVLAILLIYVGANFMLTVLSEIGKGVPQRLNGEFVIHRVQEGNQRVFINEEDASSDTLEYVDLEWIPVLRMAEGDYSVFIELTEDDYYRRTTRLATGHWLLFFLLPAFYFWYSERM